MPREREEELSKGAKGVLSAIQGKKEESTEQKSSSRLLSRNIVRGRAENTTPSKKKQQTAKLPNMREEIEDSEDFFSEDWSESEDDINDSAATAAFVRANNKKVRDTSETKKAPLPEEEAMDEIEKAYKIMEEDVTFLNTKIRAGDLDCYWHRLQKKDRWYAGKKPLVCPSESISDISSIY